MVIALFSAFTQESVNELPNSELFWPIQTAFFHKHWLKPSSVFVPLKIFFFVFCFSLHSVMNLNFKKANSTLLALDLDDQPFDPCVLYN